MNTFTHKRPVIGLTSTYGTNYGIKTGPAYLNAIWEAGGIPAFLAYSDDERRLAEYAEEFDGFIFVGGVDVNPTRYGEEKMFDSVEVNDERDVFELTLAKYVRETGKPTFGICRGVQLLNVSEGGTLYQHIDGHKQAEPGKEATHPVRVTRGTLLYDILGKEETMVNSFHHEAVKDTAPSLISAGVNQNDICEAVYKPDHRFYLGVQWHPELMYKYHEDAAKLFRAFVGSCNK